MEWLSNPEIWVAFLTLTALEIVLGIDNIIFISILVSRLPKEQQPKARFFGLALAMGTRILLLLSITWIMRLTADLFHVFDQGIVGQRNPRTMHHDIGVERKDGLAVIGGQHAGVRASCQGACVNPRLSAAVDISPGERQFLCVDDPAQGRAAHRSGRPLDYPHVRFLPKSSHA